MKRQLTSAMLERRDLMFLDDLNRSLLSPRDLRISSLRAKHYDQIADILGKGISLDPDAKQQLIKEVFSKNRIDIEHVIWGKLEELNEDELKLLLENETIFDLRKRNRPADKETEKRVIQSRLAILEKLHPDVSRGLRSTDDVDFYKSLKTQEELDQHLARLQRRVNDQLTVLVEMEKDQNIEEKVFFLETQVSVVENFLDRFLSQLSEQDCENLGILYNERFYVRGYFLKKIKKAIDEFDLNKGIETIRGLYETIQKSFQKSYKDANHAMRGMVQALYQEAKKDLRAETAGVSIEVLGDETLSDEDIGEMLQPRRTTRDGTFTYAELCARKVSDLQSKRLAKALNDSSQPKYRKAFDYEKSIRETEQEFKNVFEDFKAEKYTLDYLIDHLDPRVAHFSVKDELKRAVRFLKNEKISSGQELHEIISLFETPEDVEIFLQEQREKAKKHLVKKYEADGRSLELSLRNDPDFDIFDTRPYQQEDELEYERAEGSKIKVLLDRLKKQRGDAHFEHEEDFQKALVLVKEAGIEEEEKELFQKAIRNTKVSSRIRERWLKEFEVADQAFDEFTGKSLEDVLQNIHRIKRFKRLKEAEHAITLLSNYGKLQEEEETLRGLIREARSSERKDDLHEEFTEDVKQRLLRDIDDHLHLIRSARTLERFENPQQALPLINTLASENSLSNEMIEYLLKITNASDTISDENKKMVLARLKEFFGVDEQKRKEYVLGISKEEARNLGRSDLLSGGPLETIQKILAELQGMSAREFKDEKDLIFFDKRVEEINSILDAEEYVKEEPLVDENGHDIFENGERIFKTVRGKKKLPAKEELQLNALIQHHENTKKYTKSKKELEKLNPENEEELRQALSILYADFYELKEGTQMSKLTKVMSLDHRITAIRFHAKTKKPLELKGKFEIYEDAKGDPITFRKRSKKIITKAKELLQQGNFAAIERLFRRDEEADMLYRNAIFLPVKSVTTKPGRENVLYEHDKDTGMMLMKDEKPIPKKGIPKRHYSFFFPDLPNQKQRLEREEKALEQDFELRNIIGRIADDDSFFEENRAKKEAAFLEEFGEHLILKKDGSFKLDEAAKGDMTDAEWLEAQRRLNNHFSNLPPEEVEAFRKFMKSGGGVFGASMGPADEWRIPKEKIEQMAKEHPLIAKRAMELNSILLGRASAKTQLAGRYMKNAAVSAPKASWEFLQNYWKDLKFYTPQTIYMAVTESIEHISNLADFRTKYGAYTIMATVFNGTVVGSEFEKLQQSKETERMNSFQDAMSQYGNLQVIDKFYNARDRFEFKAAHFEAFQKRGVVTMEHLLRVDYLKALNKFHPNVIIPIEHTDEEMQRDPDIKTKVLDQIRQSLDTFWGEGTFQSFKNDGVAKYESVRKSSYDNFNGYSPVEKTKAYSKLWENLKTDSGKEKLRRMHPAEIVGMVDNEIDVGWLNSGQIFTILQAMLCEGFLSIEHVNRLQIAHTNDRPIYVLLEPEQARLCGLSAHIRESLERGDAYDYNNPIVQFYEGVNTLDLKGFENQGKWGFCKTQKDFNDKEKAGQIETIVVTAHQLQKMRQAQPEHYRKMDNSSIGLFIPAYPWSEVQSALKGGVTGELNARPHDIVAAYRGIHHVFTANMNSLADKNKLKIGEGGVSKQQGLVNFNRCIWYAYDSIAKTCAFGSLLARQKGRKHDFNTNLMDGSPNFESPYEETMARTGKSNFEEMVLATVGLHQRMLESAEWMDADFKGSRSFNVPGNTSIDGPLRAAFKRMAGFQYHSALGVDATTGDTTRQAEVYDTFTFNPQSEFKNVMKPFVDNILKLARERGIEREIRASLNISAANPMGVFGNFHSNEARQLGLQNYFRSQARLT